MACECGLGLGPWIFYRIDTFRGNGADHEISIAGQIYRSTDKPLYLIGHACSLGFWVVGLLALTLEWYIWRSRNAARDAMTQEAKDKMDDQGIDGDHHHSFRYVL